MDRSLRIVGHPPEEKQLSEKEKAQAIAVERQMIAQELASMQMEIFARVGITKFPLDRLRLLWHDSDEEAMLDWLGQEGVTVKSTFWSEPLVILPR